MPGQLKQLEKTGGSADNAKGKGRSKTNENTNARSQEKAHPHDYQYDTDLPGNSEKGLENALAHGKGHKYGIYKRLARRGLIVNSSGDIVPIGSAGDDVSGDDGDGGDGSGGIPTVGNSTGAVPDEFGIYYYHGDHLGSSNLITDRKGRNYEHMEYFPYGETWVDEQRNTTHLPYRFTGKELDPETGMYYFGARYYEPVTSRWISTDPIDRFNSAHPPTSLSLYQYGLWNPVRMVDPTGMEDEESQGIFGWISDKYNEAKETISKEVAGLFHDVQEDVSVARKRKYAEILGEDPDAAEAEVKEFIDPLREQSAEAIGEGVDMAAEALGTKGLTKFFGIFGMLKKGKEAWRGFKVSRPLSKMGHAKKHLKDFQKLDPKLGDNDVAQILEYVRHSAKPTAAPHGGKLYQTTVNIGGNNVTVKVVETSAGNIKTGYPTP